MIRFLLIPLLAVILLPLNAANPIRNASFELGCSDWDLVRFSRQDTVFRDAVSDASNPVHGTKSLRIENPDADTIELSGREVLLKKNHTYTLSWYAKSSQPLRFRGAMVAENRARQWFVYLIRQYDCGMETLSMHVHRTGELRIHPEIHLGKLERDR